MKRKIHLIGAVSLIICYISIGLLVNAKILTNNLSNDLTISPESKFSTYRQQWLISIVAILILSISSIMVIGCGIMMLINIENAPSYFRKANIILGIIYILGGLGVAPLISIYLYAKE